MSVGKICLEEKYLIKYEKENDGVKEKQSHNNHQVIHLVG